MSTRRLYKFDNKVFLVIGPSGVGKSTLINAIYNQSVDAVSLRGPAEVSDSMNGCTSACDDYSANGVKLIDTIGLTDPRFTMEEVFAGILKMIRQVQSGIHGVIVCIKHGRTANESENWFLGQTKHDADAAFLFNATNQQYITGSFIVDNDADVDKLQLAKKREPFLKNLLLMLSSYKEPINLNFELTYEGLINVVYNISCLLRQNVSRARVAQFLKEAFMQIQWVKDMFRL